MAHNKVEPALKNLFLTTFSRVLLLTLIMFQLSACTGTRPANLGKPLSALEACPDSPNCVSSLAARDDTEHYIEAIAATGQQASLATIKTIIAQWEDAEIIVDSENYLYAEFTSKLMRFVDDVEFLRVPGTVHIEVRSASRLGYRDFGVNRERIEAIREQYRQQEQ